MPAVAWLAVGLGVFIIAVVIAWTLPHRPRQAVATAAASPREHDTPPPAAVDDAPGSGNDVSAIATRPDTTSTRDIWEPPAPEPTTTTADDHGVIWTPDRARADAGYFHQIDDLLARYLPNASVSSAFIFEDHEDRWIASTVYNFATRTFEPARAPIPATEPLP